MENQLKTITVDGVQIEVSSLHQNIQDALRLREEWLIEEAALTRKVVLYRSAAAQMEREIYEAIRPMLEERPADGDGNPEDAKNS